MPDCAPDITSWVAFGTCLFLICDHQRKSAANVFPAILAIVPRFRESPVHCAPDITSWVALGTCLFLICDHQRKSAANVFSGDSGYLPIAIC
jgi:uncharacterized membrane protein YhiD involved in acid resistance